MARRHALVVGVERYAHLPDLPAAGVDARNVEQVLATRGDFEVTRLDSPNREEFGRALEDMFGNKALLSVDTLLFYFAGHGLDSDDRDRFFLTASDTDPHYPDTTGIDAETIKNHLNNTYARAKVILLDSCFSGHMGDNLRSRGDGRVSLKAPLDRKGTFVLTATDRTTYAFEDPRADGQSALFTTAVVEALEGAAKDVDADGWISVQDVAHYVQNREEVLARQKPQTYSHSVNGAIPLARVGESVSEVEPVPAARVAASRPEPPDDPHAPLDRATWNKLLRYYTECLKRESGLSDWFRFGDSGRSRLWTSGSEQVFAGPSGPVVPPELIRRFCDRDDEAQYFYGYPLMLVKKGARAEYAPLLITPMDATADALEAGLVELNSTVLEYWGLEAGDISQLADKFAQNFRPGDPAGLAELLNGIARAHDIPMVEDLDPVRLSDDLRGSPIVEGLHNVGLVWRDDGSKSAVRNLIRDLGEYAVKALGEFGGTALSALARRDTGPVAPSVPLVAPGPLNESQEAVVEAAMTRRLTVATGPPGTGKTALVTALCATAEAADQTVLVASTNHRAVDGVCEKLDAIAPGMIIRTGPKQIQEAEPQRLGNLLDSLERPSVDPQVLGGRLRSVQKKLGELRAALDARCEAETDLYAVHRHLARIKPAHGPEALALLDGDDRQLDRAVADTERSLRRWPMGIWARRSLRQHFGAKDITDRQRLGELFATERTRREYQKALDRWPEADDVWDALKRHSSERVELGQDYSRALTTSRLRTGETVIRTRISRMNQKVPGAGWKDFKKVLRHLPGWAVNGHSSTAIVPTPALFDLVIIDEAAQCATPYVLALLMRAKRALIIGDPNQLQPVVQLSKEDDEDLRRSAGLGATWLRQRHLGFVGESIYSACSAAAGEELLLDEHYRCDPDIVAIPNRVVYQNRLTVLTDRSGLALPADPPAEPAVEILDVPSNVEHPPSGSCRNPTEANEVVGRAAKILTERDSLSIGIVTPFKAQERLLESLVRHRGIDGKVAVGTIHTFQGGERDVILLSPVGAADIKPRSAAWVRGETNLWNVAITRAKSRLIVVCDRGWWTGGPGLLAQLIDGASDEQAVEVGDRAMLDRLQEAIVDAGLPLVRRNTVIAGQPCHLLLDTAPVRTAMVVEDAGVPDGKRHRQFLARLDLVEAAGYRVIRVPAWRALAEPVTVATEIRSQQ